MVMMQPTSANTATGGWADVFLGLGRGMADSLSETALTVAQAKMQQEANRAIGVDQQRFNDTTTNQDVAAATAPVKGRDADGSTIVSEPVQIGGLSVSRSTLVTAGIAAAVLLGAGLVFKVVKG